MPTPTITPAAYAYAYASYGELQRENAVLRSHLEEHQWRAVQDCPPPAGCTLLLHLNTGTIILGFANTSGITHWMPLPARPAH
jgi:hypothetical protein